MKEVIIEITNAYLKNLGEKVQTMILVSDKNLENSRFTRDTNKNISY